MPKAENKLEIGLHVQMMEQRLEADNTIARLTMYVYPLPAGALVKELGDHLTKCTHEFFLAKNMVEEEGIDLLAEAKGTIQ